MIGGYILGKIKDLFRGEHGTFFKFVAVCLALFIILWIVGPGNTVIHWARSKSELRHQKKQVELYQKEIEQMRRQVEMLQNTRDSLENFARDQFMCAAPGEDVFIVE